VHADEAANVVRGQIDALYDKTATERAVQQAPATSVVENVQYTHQQQNAANPYQRTHNEQQHQIETSAWQKYHSAWQSYYQQYYERYYVSQVHEAKKSLESQQAERKPVPEMPITTDEAMYDLRSKLRSQVEVSAKKVRKSRHFMPAMAAVAVLLVFLFLQYNRILFATVEAYVTPGNMDPSSLVVDPATQGAVGPDPRLIIPKINVDVPIIWDAVAADQN
jgi:sortase A